MMNIRELRPSDIDKLKRLWEIHYKDKFPFPNFFRHFVSSFVVLDDHENIISAAGVRTILESVVITDQDRSVRTRYEALSHILNASVFFSQKMGYDEITAFIQSDPKWEEHLRSIGFVDIKGTGLVLGVSHNA